MVGSSGGVIRNLDVMRSKIEESEKASSCQESNPGQLWFEPRQLPTLTILYMYIEGIVRVGGCPGVMVQWQSTGGSSQRCPGFNSQRLPDLSLSDLIISKFLYLFCVC